MAYETTWIDRFLPQGHPAALSSGALLADFLGNFVAGAAFRQLALAGDARDFLFRQVVANLAGFLTVVSLTVLLRFVPLSIAYPVTTGLAVNGVQVVAAFALFREPIVARTWLGTALIVLGLALASHRAS